MASEKQQQLAAFIKNVHRDLRSRSRIIGVEEAWKEHCKEEGTLQVYASAMQQLATQFWDINAEDESKSAKSRIDWVIVKSTTYFLEGGKQNERLRERKRTSVISYVQTKNVCSNTTNSFDKCISFENENCKHEGLLSLLDVGSCYNPFKISPIFQVLPIDLVPASSDVFHCDFLNVDIFCESEINFKVPTEHPIKCFRESSFDVVVFSLLLEYMPSPEQRYECCVKAHAILKPEGLLFIITPDSKHATANAPLMKCWRVALAMLGFNRVYYEKLSHIHCMAYRKSPQPEVHRHWASQILARDNYCNSPAQLMNIPQDFYSYKYEIETISGQSHELRNDVDDQLLVDLFAELPDV